MLNSQKNKKINLVEIAYNEIKDAIISSEIKPGEYLSSNKLAAALDMSRTPIREALNMLASEGYVQIQNGVGVYVKNITIKEIKNLYEVRIALETIALKKAIKNMPSIVLIDLKKQWKIYHNKILNNENVDLSKISELDFNTHLIINGYADNEYLEELLKDIYAQVKRIQYMSAKALNNPLETVTQHLEMLTYIENKEYKDAIEFLERHINIAVQYLLKEDLNISVL